MNVPIRCWPRSRPERRILLCGLLALMAHTGCNRQDTAGADESAAQTAETPVESPVVARWQGGVLRRDEVLHAWRIRLVGEKHQWERRSVMDNGQVAIAREFVREQVVRALIRRRAAEMNIAVSDEDLQAQRDELEAEYGESLESLAVRLMIPPPTLDRQLRDRALRDAVYNVVTRDVPLDEEEVDRRLGEQFSATDETWITLRQIVVEEREQAQTLHRELTKDKQEFAELARSASKAPEADKGGLMGVFARGQLPQYIEEVVFELKAGKVSEPIRSSYGYHLFLVDRIFDDTNEVREHFRPQIENQVLRETRDRAFNEWLTRTWNEMEVRINEGIL